MYSVLIQNQRTSHIFKEYMPLFSNLIKNGEMGCCRWIESGDTVDTALPGLRDLIADKGDWRAIVVLVEGESLSESYETMVNNPYDFIVNCTPEKKNHRIRVTESPIPLVRLSQMLGGVPSPELEFEEDEKGEEEGKVPYIVYKAVDTEEVKEDRRKYHELVKKYEFDGRAPLDVVFVMFRGMAPKPIREDILARLDLQSEETQADFCRRNKYSSVSRFVKYDYIHEGSVILESDYLNFWICVVLLASQTIDPSSLQAYRVYNIKADISKEELKRVLQSKIELLTIFKAYIQKEIREELSNRIKEKRPAPNYVLEVPISSDKYTGSIDGIEKIKYSLTPNSISDELRDWENDCNNAERELKRLSLFIEKIVDESAEKSKEYASFPLDDVKYMDKFERREMENQLSVLFDEIINMQNGIAATEKTATSSKGITEEVSESIKKRISKGYINELLAGASIGGLLCCVPAFIFLFRYHLGGFFAIGITFFAIFVFITVVIAIYQIIRKVSLEHNVNKYNNSYGERVVAIGQQKKTMSDLLNAVVSHQRGRRYLDDLSIKGSRMDGEAMGLQRHLACIDQMIEKIKKWSKSMFLTINFDASNATGNKEDYSYLLYSDKPYTLCEEEEYRIPLNESGKSISSPFVFVKKLNLEREELFEYDRKFD